MLSRKEIRDCPRDNHTSFENLESQPLNIQKVFNRPDVLTVGWYPVCPSKEIKRGGVKSFNILHQRIVIYRTKKGDVFAHDSFCPHMGVDLGNGHVVNEKLRCPLHHWKFDNDGKLLEVPCGGKSIKKEKVKLKNYPAQDKFGFIWVHSDEEVLHDLPNPLMIEGESSSMILKRAKLMAHHHVLYSNSIDHSHLKRLHNLNIDFEYEATDKGNGVFTWIQTGLINTGTIPLRLTKLLFGKKFAFNMIFAGGTMAGVSFKLSPLFNGLGPSFPPINVVWGAMPTLEGVSEINVMLVVKKHKGLLAPIKTVWTYLISLTVLAMLRDEDTKVFPHMRFNIGCLTDADHSLAKFVSLFNTLKISTLTKNNQ